jgi:hypothetical protein
MTHEEAFALAQDEFEQTILQIPCAEGQNQARTYLRTASNNEWQTFMREGHPPNNTETEYILVSYCDFYWRVYCATGAVAPISVTYENGSVIDNTWQNLQDFISVFSTYCY